jgi:argininosuccinate lyase
MKKLWEKENVLTNTAVEKFTVGNDQTLDLALARYDIQGSLAHVTMLGKVGLLTNEETAILSIELKKLYQQIEQEGFTIAKEVEDVHSQIELLLTAQLGEVGKRIHAGRSRNDQVLVDLRLYFRAELREIVELTHTLFQTLQAQSEAHKAVLIPGYTHLQVAMVSSFGLWFGAYAETLCDDVQLLQSVYRIVNQNPLGSGAGYGGSLPIDRTLTTNLLGFDDLNYNVVHAQMGRGKTEHFMAFGLAALGHTLGKWAMDICLYMSQNFSFLTLPDTYTTGSSIMPHKKNPDVLELLRGKANRLQSLPTEVALLTSNLPSGYHRDFQLLKEIIFPALTEIKTMLRIANDVCATLRVKTDILHDEKYQYLYTVEAVNDLVMSGVPFREAYQQIGKQIENETFTYAKNIEHTHEGSIGNLCTEQIAAKMTRLIDGFQFKKVEQAIVGLLA